MNKTITKEKVTLQTTESPINGNQDESKILAAQNALKELQSVLSQGTEPVKDALLKAEEVLNWEANSSSLEPILRKTLEDLSQMIDFVKQLERQKDLGERLEKIAEETKKAHEEISLVVIPILAEILKNIPIPRIESSDHSRDYWVDNIVLCGYDVLPDHIQIHLESDSNVSIRETKTNYSYTKYIITLGQIRMELKNLDFFYKKKTFPEMVESGKMFIRLCGARGSTLKLIFLVEQSPEDKFPKFREGSAVFDIEKFEIIFDKNTIHHDVLLPMVSQLFKTKIRNLIEREVERSLSGLGDQILQALSTVNRPN